MASLMQSKRRIIAAAPHLKTIENEAIGNFSTDLSNSILNLTVGIEPVQAGSGNPSPDNVRPITGWDSVNVHVSPTINAEDGQTYSITFPSSAGTVYGGTLDVTNGKLTVDRVSVDMGELGWVFMNVNGTRRLCSVVLNPLPLTPNSDYYMPEIICSVYKVVNVNQLPNITYSISMGFRGYGYGNRLIVNDETITTVEQTVEKLSGQTCVYKLLTPTTYTLTASQIRTLLGENNIWADTGNIVSLQCWAH